MVLARRVITSRECEEDINRDGVKAEEVDLRGGEKERQKWARLREKKRGRKRRNSLTEKRRGKDREDRGEDGRSPT